MESADNPTPFERACLTALSKSKLNRFWNRADGQDNWMPALGRYTWNVALCQAPYPLLHVVEITLRNQIYDAVAADKPVVGNAHKGVPCWLDADPAVLLPDDADAVSKAKQRFNNDQRGSGEVAKPLTPGRLVGELHFGFWTRLVHGDYANARTPKSVLWPRLIHVAFPNAPATDARGEVHRRLQSIKELRNRVFHHDPIWRRKLWDEYSSALELLGWMNLSVAEAINKLNRPHFRNVFKSHSDYLKLIQQVAADENEAVEKIPPA